MTLFQCVAVVRRALILAKAIAFIAVSVTNTLRITVMTSKLRSFFLFRRLDKLLCNSIQPQLNASLNLLSRLKKSYVIDTIYESWKYKSRLFLIDSLSAFSPL